MPSFRGSSTGDCSKLPEQSGGTPLSASGDDPDEILRTNPPGSSRARPVLCLDAHRLVRVLRRDRRAIFDQRR